MTHTTTTTITAAALIAVASGAASADLAIGTDPVILSPYDDAAATVEWVGSSAGYTGELNWLDAAMGGSADITVTPTTLWDNKNASTGQSWRVPRLFDRGERVDFEYDIVKGGIDAFSTRRADDIAQFRVDDTDPTRVIVGVEDIRLPGGDADFSDAVFAVAFSPAVPAPSGAACLALAGVLGARRRR